MNEINVKLMNALVSYMDSSYNECISGYNGLRLQKMLLHYYIYVCGSVAQLLVQEPKDDMDIDWRSVLQVVRQTREIDSIYAEDSLTYLKECLLFLNERGLLNDCISDKFPFKDLKSQDLMGRIHQLSISTIYAYQTINSLGNPFAPNLFLLPVVLQIQNVMNEPVFTVPLFSYWLFVYLISEKKHQLKGEYWDRNLSSPKILYSSLLELGNELQNTEGICYEQAIEKLYGSTLAWKQLMPIVKIATDCILPFDM